MSERDLDAILSGAPLPPAPPLGDALERELAGLAPVRARNPRRDVAIVLAASLAYAGAWLALLRVRRDCGELPVAWLVAYASAWFASFASLIWIAVVPAKGAMMPRWRPAGVGAFVAAAAFMIGGLLLDQHGPSSLDYGLAHIHHGHWCLEIGVAIAIVPASLGSIVLRGSLPVGARWAAAALGAAGGSLGGLVLHLHCRIADRWHLGLVHGGVVLVSALIGAALAPRAKLSP